MVLNTSTWQLFATYQTGHKKGHRWSTSTWHYNIFVYALIYAFIYSCTWVKEKLHWNSYTNFISEVINIDFRQIWHFDLKGTRWVGLELSIIFMQTVGSFNMWVTPYTGILTLGKLKYFMSTDLRTKTQSCTAANNTRTHWKCGTRNIVCKG